MVINVAWTKRKVALDISSTWDFIATQWVLDWYRDTSNSGWNMITSPMKLEHNWVNLGPRYFGTGKSFAINGKMY